MMRFALFAVICLALAGCQAPVPGTDPGTPPVPSEDETEGCAAWLGADVPQPRVTFETNKGTIVAEICRDAVPVTAKNFIDLVSSGYYDGTKFHRIITDFMMQGGDPNSKDDDPSDDGRGGPGYAIEDEFHRLLRHDRAGVLSMANSGPNSGGSQFFITFAETPWLDDKHAVFGHVVRGLSVLDAVEAVGSSSGTPMDTVVLKSAKVSVPGELPKVTEGVSVWAPVESIGVQMADQTVHALFVVENLSPSMQTVTISADTPAPAVASVEQGYQTFDLPARQRVTIVLEVDMPSRAGERTVAITATGEGGTGNATIHFVRDGSAGPATVQDGDEVTANYVGLTVDGRVFDTSRQDVGDYAAANDLGFGGFAGRPSYSTFQFTVGGGVIAGFSELALGTPEGGADAARIPASKAYGERGGHALAGRTLLFHLDVLEITP